MKFYAAFLEMADASKNQTYRQQHLDFLKQCEEEGKIFAYGPLLDGSGGLVIYIAGSLEEAEELAKQDPYIIEKVRNLNIREWGMKLAT